MGARAALVRPAPSSSATCGRPLETRAKRAAVSLRRFLLLGVLFQRKMGRTWHGGSPEAEARGGGRPAGLGHGEPSANGGSPSAPIPRRGPTEPGDGGRLLLRRRNSGSASQRLRQPRVSGQPDERGRLRVREARKLAPGCLPQTFRRERRLGPADPAATRPSPVSRGWGEESGRSASR